MKFVLKKNNLHYIRKAARAMAWHAGKKLLTGFREFNAIVQKHMRFTKDRVKNILHTARNKLIAFHYSFSSFELRETDRYTDR